MGRIEKNMEKERVDQAEIRRIDRGKQREER